MPRPVKKLKVSDDEAACKEDLYERFLINVNGGGTLNPQLRKDPTQNIAPIFCNIK
jgi:hypothetical protein